MVSVVHYICIAFVVLLIQLVKSALDNKLICPTGHEVSFTCPCCPEEFDDCRFKKLFKGGYIARDGALYNGSPRFKLAEDNTHITLKECKEDDEGTYVWMCGRCNVNKQFHLEVQGSDYSEAQNLTCSIGDEVAFNNPCPDDFKTCTFRKLNGNGNGNVYILRKGGILDDNLNYDLGHQNRVTLKDCKEENEGIYEWICEDCKVLNKLMVYQGHDHAEKQNYRLSRAGSSPCVWPIAARWIITSNLLILSIMKIFCVP